MYDDYPSFKSDLWQSLLAWLLDICDLESSVLLAIHRLAETVEAQLH